MNDAAPPLPRASRRVARALAERGHFGGIRVLSASARTAAEAAAALGVEQRQIVKSLVFRGARSGAPVLALVGGTSRVDPALLERHLGEPVERAEPAWVRERTGFAIGGVPPLGHGTPIRTVADAPLAAEGELWAAAGTPHAVFALRGAELSALTGAELAPIAALEPAAAPAAAREPVRGADPPAGVRVETVVESSAELVAAVASLVGELSSSAAPPSAGQVRAIVESPACHLLVARDASGPIIGMLTLVVFPIPTGVRAWIEDVVVAAAARGRGVGALLNVAALRLAGELGARTVELTSRPSREAANRLYAKLGFEPRETNVYRHSSPRNP